MMFLVINVTYVTMLDDISTPKTIADILRILDKHKMFAASAPVQTPENGNGIETKIIKPKYLRLLIIFDLLYVLLIIKSYNDLSKAILLIK